MDMRFHWLRDRKLRDMLRFYWRPGTMNLADYFTKHHPPAHHKSIRKEYLTPQSVTSRLAHVEEAMMARLYECNPRSFEKDIVAYIRKQQSKP